MKMIRSNEHHVDERRDVDLGEVESKSVEVWKAMIRNVTRRPWSVAREAVRLRGGRGS